MHSLLSVFVIKLLWDKWWFLPDVRFEFNKFLGDFIVIPLRQNSQDGPSSLVHLNTLRKGEPTGARALKNSPINLIEKLWKICKNCCLFNDVLQLKNSNAHKAILASEAVVLNTNMKLEKVQLLLISNGTKKSYKINCLNKLKRN